MNPERWQQIDQLFHEALAKKPDERIAFLAKACAGDQALRLEVESLISSHENGSSFIESAAGAVAAELLATDRPRFEPGQQIESYTIVRHLGSGGMGEVYLAVDTKLGRKVALKLLPEMFTRDSRRVRRFEQEARAASALNHPNILTIYEINEEGLRFIATEFIDGQTLRERLQTHGLEVDEARNVSEQIACALEAAHADGIVHRDIKPENIMFRHDGIVKLLDFGLAKLAENRSVGPEDRTTPLLTTSASILMGTTHYMSPEQVRGQKVDGRTDIFSLGAVLYEMLTGKKAFNGETSSDVIASVLRSQPTPISHTSQKVPIELERIVMKALEKDREQRYGTINDMLLDLRRLKQKRTAGAASAFTESTANLDSGLHTVAERVSSTDERASARTSTTELIITAIKRRKLSTALIASIVVVGVTAAIFLSAVRPQPLSSRDTILIADFVNTTGDPVFDGTLRQALSVQLAQSPYLNVFPEERIRETLAYMDKSGEQRLTRELAREICERQGLKAMLVGTIASLGNQYVITIEAITQSGDSIAHEQSSAESKEKVLASLGATASRLRRKLGESLASIQKYDVPIEQATTSSLEALKAFTMGNEERAKGRERASLPFYERAVALDPNFAMAYARIGVFYGNQGEPDTGSGYIKKAYDLRDRISDRERLYISEKYQSYVVGDLLKSIEIMETWSRLYPDDYIPHNNLAMNYLFLARYEEAINEAREAIKLRPTSPTPRGNLVVALLGTGRIDEAAEADKELAAHIPDALVTRFNKYMFSFLRGNRDAMNAEIDASRGKAEEADFISVSVSTALYFGQLAKAEDQSPRAVDLFVAQGRKETATQVLTTLAEAQAMFGKCGDARRNLKQALELSRTKSTLLSTALVLVECNDLSQGQSLLEEAIKNSPQDTLTVVLTEPVIRAVIETQRGNHSEAIKLLESVKPYDFGTLTGTANNYARGHVNLKLNKGSDAAGEFQTVIDRGAIDPFNPKRALAHLGLARAAALAGDISRSQKAYQDFFTLWKDADQNLPVLIEAKREYQLLNARL